MRKIEDKSAFIEEIQLFLIGVTKDGEALISKNGIYDEKTKLAVKNFKRENGMPEDSVVDYETFELLYLKYLEAGKLEARTMQRGDRGNDVLELNMLLRGVGSAYSEFIDYEHTDYFSSDTERSIYYLKEIFGFELNDSTADGVFTERLRAEYQLIQKDKI